MTLTIFRIKDSSKDIEIIRTSDGDPVECIYLSQKSLRDLVFWTRWYENDEDARTALGCNLKPGEVTHVG